MSADEDGQLERPDDHGRDGRALWTYWNTEFKLYEERFKPWLTRCTRILERYIDKKGEAESALCSANFLWAGMAVLGPATYTKRAKPVVDRRFKDRNDVARVASEILERCLTKAIDCPSYDATLKRCRLDFLLLGRATSWVRYDAAYAKQIVTITDEVTGEKQEREYEDVTSENVYLDYIHRSDFGHTAGARIWPEVYAGWKIVYLTREQCVEHFGKDVGEKMELDYMPSEVSERQDGKETKYEHFKKAKVYEVVDHASGKTMWYSGGYKDGPLKVEDGLDLSERRFPFPEPAYGTLTNDNLVPMPDPSMVEALYDEIDNLTKNISDLTTMVKVVGAYDASAEQLQGLLTAENGQMLGVANWTMLKKQKGGTNSLFEILDIAPVVAAIKILYEAREVAKQLLYEITGSSDILRGATSPSETARAQELKSQYASMRLSEKQTEFSRFVRDGIAIMGEIIAEKFDPRTIALMANVQAMDPSEQQLFQPAVELLRRDSARGFVIDIETDSTIAADEEADKKSVGELLDAVGTLLERALPIVQQVKELGPVIVELIMLAVRRHRAGRSVEDNLEAALNAAVEAAQAPQQPQPDPKVMEVQQKGQLAQQQQQIDAQTSVQEQRMDYELRMKELEVKMAEIQTHAQVKAEENASMTAKWQAELEQAERRIAAELKIEQDKTIAELLGKARDSQADLALRAQEADRSHELQQRQLDESSALERERMAKEPKEA